ncbi:uncharacterized protein LOC132726941 [Ruditapes philippinarum]|uniref:uncharacterized protein LOC132726941 n=1 Tax=Ruditapes philippinarum TaxID=129788 RepID=UPI00295A8613|nr:uncharacterized protein LOC132726941 [Ruditapes philippinarum]
MKTTLKLNDFILIQCLLMYYFIQQYHVAYARCSWGSWLSWNCSCCGNSYDIQVFRVRAKCCNHTHECPARRMSSSDILDENKFEEKSSCLKDCDKLFSNYNPHTCTSSKMSLNEIKEQSKIKSCKATCLGTPSTTTTRKTTTTTAFAAKPTTTKVTRETTLHNVTSQTTQTFRGGENDTIPTRNVQHKTSITSSLQTSSSIKDTTIFPGDVTVHVSKRMTSAKTSVTYPSSSKFQSSYTVSSEINTQSIGWIIGGVICLVVMAICIGMIGQNIKQTRERQRSEHHEQDFYKL